MVRFLLAAVAALAAPAAATSMSSMLALTSRMENEMANAARMEASTDGMQVLRDAFEKEISDRAKQIQDLEKKMEKLSAAIQKNKENKAAKNQAITTISSSKAVHETQQANKEEKLATTNKILNAEKSKYVQAMAARTDTAQRTAQAAVELKQKSDTIQSVQKEIETNLASTLSADTLDSVSHIMTQLVDANKAAMVTNDKEESQSRRSMSETTLRWSKLQKSLHKTIQQTQLDLGTLNKKIGQQQKDLMVNKDELKLAGDEQVSNETQLEEARDRLQKTRTALGMVKKAKEFIVSIAGEVSSSQQRAAGEA